MNNIKAKCINCNKEFKENDTIQCFLRSPDDEKGSWGVAVRVDAMFQTRIAKNGDKLKRRHTVCEQVK